MGDTLGNHVVGAAPYSGERQSSLWARVVAWWNTPQARPGCYVVGFDGPCLHEDGMCPSGYRHDGTIYDLEQVHAVAEGRAGLQIPRAAPNAWIEK